MSRSRASDERVLGLVRARASGLTPTQIAEITGNTVQYVSTATNRVLRDNVAACGEDVRAAYWAPSPRGAAR